MLIFLRITAVATAAVTGLLMLTGHPTEYLVADGMIVIVLVFGAAIPPPRVAVTSMLVGFAFATGVFTVAFATSIVDEAVNLRVGAGVVVGLIALVLAARLQLRDPGRGLAEPRGAASTGQVIDHQGNPTSTSSP